MNQIHRVMWGIVLIIIGLIIGTNSFEITNINIFFKGWWTLLIIIPSFIGLFNRKESIFSNFIGLTIGIILLLYARGMISYNIISTLTVPFIFITIGIYMIFNNIFKSHIPQKINNMSKDNMIVATFSEQKVNFNNQKIKDAVLDAVFGSIVLDLYNANLENETVIKSSSIFAGIKILIPEGINVQIKSTPIFGGVSNNIDNKKDNKKIIYIESFCLFGGLEIK